VTSSHSIDAEDQSSRMLVLDAAAWLLERGELDAARALFPCRLELEPPLDAKLPGGVSVRIVSPAQVAHVLLDEERTESWQARNAIAAVLPPGFTLAELTVASESVSVAGGRLALVA
jgi:hypothetical protein